jgi:hypothetical protein
VILAGCMAYLPRVKINNLCMCIELCTIIVLALIFVLVHLLQKFVVLVDCSMIHYLGVDLVGLVMR